MTDPHIMAMVEQVRAKYDPAEEAALDAEYLAYLAAWFDGFGFSAELVSRLLESGMNVPEELRAVYITEDAIQRRFTPSAEDWVAIRTYRRRFP